LLPKPFIVVGIAVKEAISPRQVSTFQGFRLPRAANWFSQKRLPTPLFARERVSEAPDGKEPGGYLITMLNRALRVSLANGRAVQIIVHGLDLGIRAINKGHPKQQKQLHPE